MIKLHKLVSSSMSFPGGENEAKSFIFSGRFRDVLKMAQKGKAGAEVRVRGTQDRRQNLGSIPPLSNCVKKAQQ